MRPFRTVEAQTAPDADVELRNTAVCVVHALIGCGAAALLGRARDAQRDVRIAHGPGRERVALAMPLALLRPLRLLNVTRAGPTYVAELPFPHAEAAMAAAVRFGDDTVPLRDWTQHEALGGWVIDEAAWARRLARVREAAVATGCNDAFEVCGGRVVVASRAREMPTGPLDGADALELILDDGSALVLARGEEEPAPVLGGRLVAARTGPVTRLVFETPRCGRVNLALLSCDGVVLQHSPVAGAGAPPPAGLVCPGRAA
jgi:hypothetical protein